MRLKHYCRQTWIASTIAGIVQNGHKSLIFIVVPHYVNFPLFVKSPWQETVYHSLTWVLTWDWIYFFWYTKFLNVNVGSENGIKKDFFFLTDWNFFSSWGDKQLRSHDIFILYFGNHFNLCFFVTLFIDLFIDVERSKKEIKQTLPG